MAYGVWGRAGTTIIFGTSTLLRVTTHMTREWRTDHELVQLGCVLGTVPKRNAANHRRVSRSAKILPPMFLNWVHRKTDLHLISPLKFMTSKILHAGYLDFSEKPTMLLILYLRWNFTRIPIFNTPVKSRPIHSIWV
jgi:hypothetical protein